MQADSSSKNIVLRSYDRRGMIRDPLPQRVTLLEKYNIIKVIGGSDQTFCLAQPFNASPNSNESLACFSWGSN